MGPPSYPLAYSPDYADQARRAAVYVDRILKGAKPADLVEQTTKLQLIINVKAAKALGFDLPQSLRVRADRLIQ